MDQGTGTQDLGPLLEMWCDTCTYYLVINIFLNSSMYDDSIHHLLQISYHTVLGDRST